MHFLFLLRHSFNIAFSLCLRTYFTAICLSVLISRFKYWMVDWSEDWRWLLEPFQSVNQSQIRQTTSSTITRTWATHRWLLIAVTNNMYQIKCIKSIHTIGDFLPDLIKSCDRYAFNLLWIRSWVTQIYQFIHLCKFL